MVDLSYLHRFVYVMKDTGENGKMNYAKENKCGSILLLENSSVSEIQTLIREKENKMNTKENALKATKEKAPIVLDSQIVKNYRELVKNSLDSHWGFITDTNSKMVEGVASVRIVKASINEASKDGKDSIIKASQVEGFGIALQLRKLSGTDKQPIATVLKASMRAKRLEGVEAVQQLLEGIKTWEGFIARLESAEEVKAEATEEAEAEEADKAKEIDLTSITWEAMVEILIKKAKGGDMRADTIDPKLGGQGIAILHQLVKNAKATQKVNA